MNTATSPALLDSFRRSVTYLRISMTDRCNLRCRYCSPDGLVQLKREQLLSLDEMYRIVRIGTGLGITKVRLTGGEPLLRRGVVDFIARLRQLPEIKDIALTTNGTLLAQMGASLKDAGLSRINISLDTLNPQKFYQITGADLFPAVWQGIQTVLDLGFQPIKINTVAMKGVNDDEIEQLAALTLTHPLHVRFIEYMPIGMDPEVAGRQFYPISDIERRLRQMGTLMPVIGRRLDGPAQCYRLEGALGEVGLIGSMSSHFCSSCNRIRLTAPGYLRPCLLAEDQIDVLTPIRRGATDADIEALFFQALSLKGREHRLSFSPNHRLHSKMVSIGG